MPPHAAPTPFAAASRRGCGGKPPRMRRQAAPAVSTRRGRAAAREVPERPRLQPLVAVAGAETDGGVPPRPALAGVRAAGRRRRAPLSTAARSAGSAAGRPPADRGAPPWAAPSDRAWPGRRPPGRLAARRPRRSTGGSPSARPWASPGGRCGRSRPTRLRRGPPGSPASRVQVPRKPRAPFNGPRGKSCKPHLTSHRPPAYPYLAMTMLRSSCATWYPAARDSGRDPGAPKQEPSP
jgi:hypothetical protein